MVSLGLVIAAGVVLFVGLFFNWYSLYMENNKNRDYGGAGLFGVVVFIALNLASKILYILGAILGVAALVVYLCGH